MTVVDDPLHRDETLPEADSAPAEEATTPADAGVDPATDERDDVASPVDDVHDDHDVEDRRHRDEDRRHRDEPLRAERQAERHDPDPGPVLLPPGPKGMRIRRVRLKSVMKLASVFFALGYLVTMGTLVVLWNVAQRLGFVADLESLVETSLGLDSFDMVGQDLFDLAVLGLGILFAMGLVITILLALVYNAACRLFGGLAVETGPLRRPRKVFSLRHRRFIDVR